MENKSKKSYDSFFLIGLMFILALWWNYLNYNTKEYPLKLKEGEVVKTYYIVPKYLKREIVKKDTIFYFFNSKKENVLILNSKEIEKLVETN